jgi:hypothetical protein
MIAVVYPSLYGTRPVSEVPSWERLVELLSEHHENADKERQAMWSPVTLAAGGTRRNAAVRAVNALVVDVDGGTAFATARERLAGRDWIAYSTFSHSAEEERYHIVVRLPEPIEGQYWAESYDDLIAEIGGGDSLRAPCHAYFLPQHRPGADWFFEVSA